MPGVHAAMTAAGPLLSPKTWYGMPAYANADGKVATYGTLAKFGSGTRTLASKTRPTSTTGTCGPSCSRWRSGPPTPAAASTVRMTGGGLPRTAGVPRCAVPRGARAPQRAAQIDSMTELCAEQVRQEYRQEGSHDGRNHLPIARSRPAIENDQNSQ